jgi:hypothetical protein
MSLVSGQITRDGAVVSVLVGVSKAHEKALRREKRPLPQLVHVRALIDTGSFVTSFMPEVFQSLGIRPFRMASIRTTSTTPGTPHQCPQYAVSVYLTSGGRKLLMPPVHAISSGDFHDEEDAKAILGRDVLDHCHFQYFGPERSFNLGF